jgi:23S rRNA (uridine2552-2'-O)-methyltransferase
MRSHARPGDTQLADDRKTDKFKPKAKGREDTGLKVKVRTARGRTSSSVRWLQRQLNDPYVVKARKEGWRSRAAFKLIEIDDKHRLLRPGLRVVDLGAAPGGWCQVAAKRTGSTPLAPLVVGIDYLEVETIPGVVLIQKDFLDDDAPAALIAALGGEAPDVVVSDMASPTTGHHKTDYIRTAYLAEVAAAFAVDVLKPGGSFVAKVFRGGTENELLTLLKQNFTTVAHMKPPSSRQESVEMYVVAKGFKGKRDAVAADDADLVDNTG